MIPKKVMLKIGIITLLLSVIPSQMQAQNAFLSSGHTAVGSGGSANYSIGQIIQEKTTGTNGSAIQGIQFTFTNATLSIVDVQTNVEVSTYPNPTTSVLNIKAGDFKTNSFMYSLYDITGKQVKAGMVSDKTTQINVNNLPNATYILKVKNNKDHSTKTFKIIKN
ncbi:hypothetical protein PK35_00025 [Tamlana nanhaiensis]|uniref:Secretion system C-terminal sorting domain-containing protein n=1 Tax=Neotamlana nanhaiensis TaxID=1382798 RepID=A0A0D7W580_9FLAO|nr:T9SS type A sorting domain-containing protein [Tamlana nanhaiensis]KJD34255.1 hypothetical protein PK35_00025 [Tamlana nanhaiensis]